MDEIKTKQQVVEKIKQATKILVTVSDNPSVDALSAALGLALLLDKQEKYATAIFSGETPPAIAFLEPEKTFDDTTDSLRDFIIALNKEKADHLRYKVVDDAVKIFITPYKTTINEDDLEFSQGDYNVELVIALGVDKQENLDGALQNHGQILHDAAIITMTAGDQTSNLGGIDWHDSQSSSLSEMVAGLAEALKDDKKKSLLDGPIATALLTGIVAETDRFSNEHTTSKAMTVAATLMSAGADQQLVANELQAAHKINVTSADDEDEEVSETDDVNNTTDDGSLVIAKDKAADAPLSISHEGETLAELDRRVRGTDESDDAGTSEVSEALVTATPSESASAQLIGPAKPTDPVESAQPSQPVEPTSEGEGSTDAAQDRDEVSEPVLGGTLNATTEQAADDARRAAENDQNKTILSHAYLGGSDPTAPVSEVAPEDTPQSLPPIGELHSAYAFDDPSSGTPQTPQEGFITGGERVIQPLSEATAPTATAPTVPTPAAAYAEPSAAQTPELPSPVASNPTPADLGLPLPPPIPDFSQLGAPSAAYAPAPPAIPLPPTQQPELLGDILAPEAPEAPALTPVPEVPVMPAPSPAVEPIPAPIAVPPVDTTVPPLPPVATAADPGQFQIPPQQ